MRCLFIGGLFFKGPDFFDLRCRSAQVQAWKTVPQHASGSCHQQHALELVKTETRRQRVEARPQALRTQRIFQGTVFSRQRTAQTL
jgi:hypothetical protein